MEYKSPSTIVGPPADALADALESVVGEDLDVIAEYDTDTFELLYVTEDRYDRQGTVDAVTAEFEGLYSYYHLDFLQRDLVEDLHWLGEIGTYVTYLEHGMVVRAPYEGNGVIVVLDVGASIDDVQVTIENTLGDGEPLPVHG
jgi:hypothetical protein